MPAPFRFDGWEDVVGNKRCFHLVGYAEVLRQLGFRTSVNFQGKKAKIPGAELVTRVVASVPDAWKAEFGADDERRQQDWTEFSIQQVTACCEKQPALLSKAMMALLFLEFVVEHINQSRAEQGRKPLPIDIYEIVRIEPAVFWVEGFDSQFHEDFLNERQDNRARRDHYLTLLQKQSGQPRARVFVDIAKNDRTCLYATAEAIIEVFKDTAEIGNKVEFEVFGSRERQPPSVDEIANFTAQIPVFEE